MPWRPGPAPTRGGARRRRELTPDTLLGVLPVAALPAALRHQVLSLVTDSSPAAVAHRLAVGQRLGPLGPSGFPRPVNPPSPIRLSGQHLRAGTAAGGAAIVGGTLLAGGLLHHHPGPGGAPGARPEPSATSPARPGASAPSGAAGPPTGAAALAGGGRPASSHPAASGSPASSTGPAGVTVGATASASAAVGVTGTL